MIVLLGELGGRDEYGVVEAMKAGAITKPVVGLRMDQVFELIVCGRSGSWASEF